MTILQTNKIFFTTTQKTLFFWAFFEIFLFHVFHVLSFSFSNMKKTKTKSAHFFSKTLFLTPWQTAKKLFSHPYTLFVFFKIPKKHYKTGEKQANKNLGPGFDATLDQVLTQRTPNPGPGFDSTAYIYICRRVTGLSTFWPFWKLIGCPPFCQNLIFTAGRSILRVNGLAPWKLIGCPLLVAIFDPKRWTTY